MTNGFNLRTDFAAALSELVVRPRPQDETTSPSGAILLGKGNTSDVWALWDEYALKLFRHRAGINVPSSMTSEMETYQKLTCVQNSGLPRLFGYAQVKGEDRDATFCGWALFSRVHGKPLTFDELSGLDRDSRKRWVHDVVLETINIENCLNGLSDPLKHWDNSYAGKRVPRMIQWAAQGRVSTEDRDLAVKLGDLIEHETARIRYLHGDFNPPNIIANLNGASGNDSIVKFVDPLISHEAHEANWRHFTLIPALADQLATEYDRQTGATTNQRLMYGIGAMTHLYMSYGAPEQASIRRPALEACLKRASMI